MNDNSGKTNDLASGFSTDLEKDLDSTDYSQEQSRKEPTEKQKKRKPIEINGILIENFLSSDNLNEQVDFLLRKEKIDLKNNINKVIRHNASGKAKEKKRRQRKNID